MKSIPILSKYYKNAQEDIKTSIENFILVQINYIIKEIIIHYCNFNDNNTEGIDLLMELSQKFRLKKENISFYVTLFNSSVYSIKNKIPVKFKEGNNNNHYNLNKKYNINNKQNNIDLDLIIIKCCDYLDNSDIINLLNINKELIEENKNKIFSRILKIQIHNKNQKYRINIWKNILKIVYYIILYYIILNYIKLN
jgi:hypothetical protein